MQPDSQPVSRSSPAPDYFPTPDYVHINARYPGRCQTSGEYYPKGRPIAYYPATKQTHSLISIAARDDWQNQDPKGHIFKYVEGAFDKWLKACQPEIRSRYERGDQDKKGAIRQAIEEAEALARQSEYRVYLHECDLTSSFS